MNVRQGDIAVIVCEKDPRNIGGFVRVIRWIGEYTFQDGTTGSAVWRVEALQRLHARNGKLRPSGAFAAASDAVLRPIRPGDISDEEVRDLYSDRTKEAA